MEEAVAAAQAIIAGMDELVADRSQNGLMPL